jgi:hypothetical protein
VMAVLFFFENELGDAFAVDIRNFLQLFAKYLVELPKRQLRGKQVFFEN